MYIELHSNSLYPCTLTEGGYAEAGRSWLCFGCGGPKPHVEGVDVRVERMPQGGLLSFVNGCSLPMMHRELLDALPRDAVREELFLRRVFQSSGLESKTWVTFRGRHRLIVRGNKDVSHRVCPECRRLLYYAGGDGYLFPAPPPEVAMFESDKFGLILRSRSLLELPLAALRGVEVEELPVLEVPRDGLGFLSDAGGRSQGTVG